MSTLLFVLIWVAIAIGLVVYALASGRRGRRRADSGDQRTTRLATATFLILTLGLGIALPYAIIRSRDDDRADIPEVNVASLTADEQEGRDIFSERCRNCHSLRAVNATAKVGPNLDDLRPPKELTVDAIENGRSRGNGQMAADLVEGEDVEHVADFLVKVAGKGTD